MMATNHPSRSAPASKASRDQEQMLIFKKSVTYLPRKPHINSSTNMRDRRRKSDKEDQKRDPLREVKRDLQPMTSMCSGGYSWGSKHWEERKKGDASREGRTKMEY